VITFPGITLPLGENEEWYTIEADETIFYIKDKAGNKIEGFYRQIKNP
jgi:hypothetical protein